MRRKKQSCLAPYIEEIIALRKTLPPTTFEEIADILKTKYEITITRSAVHSFLKFYIEKGYKPCSLVNKIESVDKVVSLPVITPEKTQAEVAQPTAEKLAGRSSAQTSGKTEVSENSQTALELLMNTISLDDWVDPEALRRGYKYDPLTPLEQSTPEEIAALKAQLKKQKEILKQLTPEDAAELEKRIQEYKKTKNKK